MVDYHPSAISPQIGGAAFSVKFEPHDVVLVVNLEIQLTYIEGCTVLYGTVSSRPSLNAFGIPERYSRIRAFLLSVRVQPGFPSAL